jgi:hypothetical protein
MATSKLPTFKTQQKPGVNTLEVTIANLTGEQHENVDNVLKELFPTRVPDSGARDGMTGIAAANTFVAEFDTGSEVMKFLNTLEAKAGMTFDGPPNRIRDQILYEDNKRLDAIHITFDVKSTEAGIEVTLGRVADKQGERLAAILTEMGVASRGGVSGGQADLIFYQWDDVKAFANKASREFAFAEGTNTILAKIDSVKTQAQSKQKQ